MNVQSGLEMVRSVLGHMGLEKALLDAFPNHEPRIPPMVTAMPSPGGAVTVHLDVAVKAEPGDWKAHGLPYGDGAWAQFLTSRFSLPLDYLAEASRAEVVAKIQCEFDQSLDRMEPERLTEPSEAVA